MKQEDTNENKEPKGTEGLASGPSGATQPPPPDSLYKEILANIGTKYQGMLFNNEIDTLLRLLFTTKTTFLEALDSSISGKAKTLITDGLTKAKIDMKDDPEHIRTFLQGAKQAVAEMVVVKLTIAIRPTQHAVELFSDWTKHAVGMEVLIDFIYEPKVIAGAIVEYKGKLKDYSVNRAIDTYFKENHT